MKRVLVIATLFLCAFVVSLSAQTVLLSRNFTQPGPVTPSYGDWQAMNGRLYQNDATNALAKINFAVPQQGVVEYDFNVRYQGGGSDMMGGFGIQVFVDKAFDGRSWGDGNSYLLWLNYDANPSYGPAGFRGEVYKSTTASQMSIVGWSPALDASYLSTDNMSMIVPVKIIVNGNTGEVTVKDPTRDNWVYTFMLPTAPGSGNYIALRTNSLAVSFGNLRVSQLQ